MTDEGTSLRYVAIDPWGDVLAFGNETPPNDSWGSAVLYRLDGDDGTIIDKEHFSSSFMGHGEALAVDESGARFLGTFSWPPWEPPPWEPPSLQTAIVRQDPRGDIDWVTPLSVEPEWSLRPVAILVQDGRVTLCAANFLYSGYEPEDIDIVVAHLDAEDGSLLWQQTFGTDFWDGPGDLAADEEGHIYVSGGTRPSPFGETPKTDGHYFLMKLSPKDGSIIKLIQIEEPITAVEISGEKLFTAGENFTTRDLATDSVELKFPIESLQGWVRFAPLSDERWVTSTQIYGEYPDSILTVHWPDGGEYYSVRIGGPDLHRIYDIAAKDADVAFVGDVRDPIEGAGMQPRVGSLVGLHRVKAIR